MDLDARLALFFFVGPDVLYLGRLGEALTWPGMSQVEAHSVDLMQLCDTSERLSKEASASLTAAPNFLTLADSSFGQKL